MFTTRPITDNNRKLAEWITSTPRFANEVEAIEKDLREVIKNVVKPIDPYLRIRMEQNGQAET